MAASMCNMGLVRRQLFLLMQKKHLLSQRFCLSVSSRKNVDHEEQVSQSPLSVEDDYFGVSIPEENWTLPRSSGLSKDEIFQKYKEGHLSEQEKDNLQFVRMPFGTVRFDNVMDTKHQKDTRDKFHDLNQAGVKDNILKSMTRVSDAQEAETAGENYYSSLLDQFKKDSKSHETPRSQGSRSDEQMKEPRSRTQKEGLRIAESSPEIISSSTKKRVAHVQQGRKVEYGDANRTSSVTSNQENRNEMKDDRRTDLNFIDQQYFKQDIVPTKSESSTRLNIKTTQESCPDEVIPELDPDMMFAHTGKEISSESKTISDQKIISSYAKTMPSSFHQAQSERASSSPKLKKLEATSDNIDIGTKSEKKKKRRFSDEEILSSRLETVSDSSPPPHQVCASPTAKLQKLETSADSVGTESTDMNFIDQQFFGEQFSDEQSSVKTSMNNEQLNYEDSKSDLNFIDKEYFKEAVSIPARKPIQSSTSEHRKFEEKVTMKDAVKRSGDEKKSKKKKKKDGKDEDSRLARLMQGNVMDALERDAIVQRKRGLLETKENESENVMDTAYGTMQTLRNKQGRNLEGGAPLRDSLGMKVMKTVVPQLYKMTTVEIVNMITRHILYDSDDIVAIYKPYGLPTHGGPGIAVSVAHLLDQIGQNLPKKQDKLYIVHRLDKETTGVMLLARTQEMAARLSEAFRERKVVKKYWVITKGTPSPQEGIIDIPMMEGSVDGKNRMVLKPNFLPDGRIATKTSLKTFKAETYYKVVSSRDNAAIVECLPLTGVRHQLRAHLSFGLNTPVLGDHKFSHLLKFAPQKLEATTLKRLGVQQSKVRHIPLHLHAMSLLIPEFLDGRNLFVTSNLPKHFSRSMRLLKLNPGGDK